MIPLTLEQLRELARRPNILPAVRGDRITLENAPELAHVQAPCAEPAVLMFGCLSCRQLLANAYELDEHLLVVDWQPHVIVRHCATHGWEPLC